MKNQNLMVNTQELSPGAIGNQTVFQGSKKNSLDPKAELFVAIVFLWGIAMGIAVVFVTVNFVIQLLKAIAKQSQEKNLYSGIKESQAFSLTPVPALMSL